MTSTDVRRSVDSAGMYEVLAGFAEQWRTGRARALEADLGALEDAAPRNVLVAGMGGSAIGGDLLRGLARDRAAVPVAVERSYDLPAWVGPETLVVLSSYSGTTEETLSMQAAAQGRGARLAVLASAGTLLDAARAEGLPHVQLPGGFMPRAALGYSLTALLTVAERAGVLTLPTSEWQETAAMLGEQGAALADASGNEARTLAERLAGRPPLLYSGTPMLDGVNRRWQTQLNENAKVLCGGNVFPELNHNEIMGWEGAGAGAPAVVVLRDASEDPRVARRIAVTRSLVEDRAAAWMEVASRGQRPLCRMLSLVLLGDWVSYYLALHRGVDPTPIGLITRLKRALAT